MQKINIGDRFKLGKWVWKVNEILYGGSSFNAEKPSNDYPETDIDTIKLSTSEADQLDWIKPEVKKLTKEQARLIRENNQVNPGGTIYLIDSDYLDSITE